MAMSTYTVLTGLDNRLLRDFLRVPELVYSKDPLWVPPLRSEVKRTLDVRKNPYFTIASQQRFVCYRDKRPVARAIVVVDPRQTLDDGTAYFGMFECTNDRTASDHLWRTVEDYARSQGAKRLEGPFNPNYYSELGIKLDQFELAPRFFETYNPHYYSSLLEEGGFKLSRTLSTFGLRELPGELLRKYAPLDAKDTTPFVVRRLRMHDLARDLDQIREVYNDAFSGNTYFRPVSRAEYDFGAKFLKYVTVPELTTIVELNGRAIAVAQFMQDVNPLLQRLGGRTGPIKFLRYQRERKRVRSLVMYAVGVRKEYQRSYAMALILRGTLETMSKCTHVSTTWVADDYVAAFGRRLGFEPDRTFGMYAKDLHDNA